MDTRLFHLLYGWFRQPPWEGVMSWVTHLGDAKIALVLATLGILESGLAWRQKRSIPLFPWFGVILGLGVTHFLKEAIHRPRPLEGLSTSFPSGHATAAFALAVVLSLRWPKARPLWWSLALWVGISRVALGEHWPSDVVAGAWVGMISVTAMIWLERRVRFT